MSRIQVMFDPKTIALIGATDKEGAVGRTIPPYLEAPPNIEV